MHSVVRLFYIYHVILIYYVIWIQNITQILISVNKLHFSLISHVLVKKEHDKSISYYAHILYYIYIYFFIYIYIYMIWVYNIIWKCVFSLNKLYFTQLSPILRNLKHQMKSFDSDFFEELEDLKSRYSKLQVCSTLWLYTFVHLNIFYICKLFFLSFFLFFCLFIYLHIYLKHIISLYNVVCNVCITFNVYAIFL